MRFDELNESNYMLFAIKFYDNPQAVTKDDFESDLKRIRYIKRLLKRYKNTIILFNVFNEAAVPLLFYNLERELWPIVKSFLIYLKRIPEYPKTQMDAIGFDQECLDQLNNL